MGTQKEGVLVSRRHWWGHEADRPRSVVIPLPSLFYQLPSGPGEDRVPGRERSFSWFTARWPYRDLGHPSMEITLPE